MRKMGLTRVIVFLMALFMSVSSYAEDSYREALRQFTELSHVSSSMAQEKMVPSLAGVAMAMYGYSMEEASILSEKFCSENLMNWVLDYMEESFKGIASESDIKAACSFYTTSRGAVALAHSESYNNQEAQQKMMLKMLPDIMKLAEGKKVDKVKSDAPSSYAKLFHKYFVNSGLQEIFAGMMENMKRGKEEDVDYDKRYHSYMEENMETIVMDAGYPTVTEEDLQALIDFTDTDSGKNISKATVNMANNAVTFGTNLIQAFSEYVEK